MNEQVGSPRRGELRIYLGAAPGVGKTYAMLNEAHRRRGRGTDVVIGFVESHNRAKTAELIAGLEVVPRKTMRYRDTEFTEMDLDAVLARKPQVALVDELAHTNVPGSRHTKRWQDIEELLQAGIDVISTVNIQHLESLGDVVERITGIRQHETVPDQVVRGADQTELVDLTPEALRRRLAHGNIYSAQKIDAALSNYFRTGNLTALRELALLWVADQVDIALQRYRADKRITETWEARERVIVAVTGGPESEMLIRRARRIASRAGAELLVLHALRGDGLISTAPQTVAELRRLAADVGASFHTVVGDDIPRALLEFARGVNGTQLVLGTSRRSRTARLFDEGIGATVVQRSGHIDVHMVTHPEASRRWRWRLPSTLGLPRRAVGWILAALGPASINLVGLVLRDELHFANLVMLQMLVVVVVAILGGLWPSLAATAFAGLLLNFFFTPPYHTLEVSDPRQLTSLVVMFIVAVLVTVIVDRAARLAERASRARTEANVLSAFTRTLLTHQQPLVRLLERIAESFGLETVTLLEYQNTGWHRVAATGPNPSNDPSDADEDLALTPDVHLAVRGHALPAADLALLQNAAGQTLIALRQQRLAAAEQQARDQAATNELQTALLSAVGHDLRTPLTSIKASLDSLRATDIELSADHQAELLDVIAVSTDRLAALVDNLLASSRLATGIVRPQLGPVSYYEIVVRALATLETRDDITIDIDERLPAVLADPGLLERVVANVIDNAQRHGSPGNQHPGPIAVRASSYADSVQLRIVDHGAGLPKGTAEQVFTPFQQLSDRPTRGLGLGLSVARGFTDAMGGDIHAEDTPGGGLTVVITLPAVLEIGERE